MRKKFRMVSYIERGKAQFLLISLNRRCSIGFHSGGSVPCTACAGCRFHLSELRQVNVCGRDASGPGIRLRLRDKVDYLEIIDAVSDSGEIRSSRSAWCRHSIWERHENPWIPYYGYGAGVVRLSLGDNSELGGNVTGGYVRWNFFVDTTVTVGDEVWVRDGKLIK